ncbi:MAG: phage gp6-like head-tail connector protein [Bacteroides sp.]|nr:phage gp6-like head-tail connector protein [Bacteroides sp.]
MPVVDLDLFKKHVRADDFADDDSYLASILEAAEESVVKAVNRPELSGACDWPPMLRQAVMLLAGHWYNQREGVAAVQMHEVPYTVQALIKPWRRLVSPKPGDDDQPSKEE